MATHSSVLAWRIPETGEPGALPSLGSHRVGHDCSNLAAAAAAANTVYKKRTHTAVPTFVDVLWEDTKENKLYSLLR